MKLYRLNRNSGQSAERHISSAESSALKKAAGGEDIVILTAEAISSFKRENSAKNREQELVNLALRHINDRRPELEDPEDDMEFKRAERLALLAELVIRVAPSGKSRNIYGRVTDFVIEQLTDR